MFPMARIVMNGGMTTVSSLQDCRGLQDSVDNGKAMQTKYIAYRYAAVGRDNDPEAGCYIAVGLLECCREAIRMEIGNRGMGRKRNGPENVVEVYSDNDDEVCGGWAIGVLRRGAP